MGPEGLLPARTFFDGLATRLGAPFLAVPSVFWWITPTDAALRILAIAGAVTSLALAWERATRWVALPLAFLYLSFASAGSAFFTFQWDSLLVETLVLCALLGPSPGNAAIWAFRVLNLKLYVESGAAKLLWSDDWSELRAMGDYWMTAPLPTPLAWYADRLPPAMQQAFTFGTILGETALPFLILAGGRARRAFAVVAIGLQLGILVTANYGSFNYLSVSLAIVLFAEGSGWRRWEALPAASWIVLSLAVGISRFGDAELPLATTAQRWRVANAYHLFASIDPIRDEVEFVGSPDGENWHRLPLAHKPPASPSFLAPYHPRVAFSAWFWTLGGRESELGLRVQAPPWGRRLVERWCNRPEALTPLLTEPVSSPRYVSLAFWRAEFADAGPGWEQHWLGRHPEVHDCHEERAPRFSHVDHLLPFSFPSGGT